MNRRITKLSEVYYSYFYWKSFVLNRFAFFSVLVGPKLVLRLLGAEIGSGSYVHHSIMFQNTSRGSCLNLKIGNHVYIGPRCLFDLSSMVEIQDNSAVSADVRFVTHSDVGTGPLHVVYPREAGSIIIRKGSWLGVGTTILHGVEVGPLSVVGAMSLVNKDVPERSVSFGIPSRTMKELAIPDKISNDNNT